MLKWASCSRILDTIAYRAPVKRWREEHLPTVTLSLNSSTAKVKYFQVRGQPVVSVDAKKKELIGHFANGGSEYQPKGKPGKAGVYNFPSLSDGKEIPYGVYDMTNNQGWVSVGTDHDTAQFAVHTI